MNTPPPVNVEEVFEVAAALPPGERAAYLDAACAGRPEVRERVEQLLASLDATEFMHSAQTPLSSEVEAEFARFKPEKASDLIGPYKLLQPLGEGGFGTVWMAEQTEPVKRRVALKIIKMGMDTKEVIARFEQERQALAMMDHPNIAKVFDAGATQWGRPFFVMELVRGVPITTYCDAQKLPVPERLALFIHVCQAVQHAHQKGIIHRDIKPSNILISTGDDHEPVPKVIDFGVAKAMDRTLTDKTLFTQFEQMIGTPAYMSPEQTGAGPMDIDTRSDIYSLGVLLYEMLTGKPPFNSMDLLRAGQEEMRRVIREQEPPKPSTRLSTLQAVDLTAVAAGRRVEPAKLAAIVRGDLDWIVMKALEKDRTRRYETANGLALDLQRHLHSEPVLARPPSFGYKAGKFIRRHKGPVAAAAAVLLTLIAGLAASTVLYLQEKAAWASEAARAAAEAAARQEAEAVSNYLIEVFQSPNPERDGRTITVAETLDRAATKLDTDLVGQPSQRAKLQETLGKTYQSLGLHRDAIPLLEKVRDYGVANLGAEHRDTLRAMRSLGHSYFHSGRRDEALKIREKELEFRRKALGPEDPDTLSAMINLASSYGEAGQRDEAFKMDEEVLALRRKVLGPEHPDTLLAMHNLAVSYDGAGRQDGRLKLREEVLALRRKVSGPEHPNTLSAMINLAISYGEAGQRDEALKLREEVLPLCHKVLGPEHPNTLLAMSNLAASYDDSDRRNEALKLREEVLPLCRKVLGPEHPNTLLAMSNLAVSYNNAGRQNEALKLREEVLPLCRKVSGPEHVGTLAATTNLAISYGAAGRTIEAIELQKQALEIMRRILPPSHPVLAVALTSMADLSLKVGRWDDACRLLAELSAHVPKDTMLALRMATLQAWFGKNTDHATTCRRWLEQSAGTDDRLTADRAAKAYCLLPSSDPQLLDAARSLARRAVDRGKDDGSLPYFQMALGMAEYRSGNYPVADEALAVAERAAKDNRHVRDPARFFHAMSLFQQGKKVEARKRFTEAEARIKPPPADEHQPLADGASHDDIIVWLAYKEAKALLQIEAAMEPVKPAAK